MAVEQECAAEAVEQKRELLLDRLMIGPVRLRDPLFQLSLRNGSAPQVSVLLGPRRDNAKAAASAGGHIGAPGSVDHRRVDLVLAAIAIDRGARSTGDDRSAAALQRSPDQAVDERVFKRGQRRLARRGERNQPIGIVTARVRHRQQYRQLASGLMDGWGGEFVHGRG